MYQPLPLSARVFVAPQRKNVSTRLAFRSRGASSCENVFFMAVDFFERDARGCLGVS